MNILLVEDSVDISDFLTNVITQHYDSHKIYIAQNYDEAVEIIAKTTFDLFILDYELDVNNTSKNGLALGRFISKNDKYKNTPIVFETSFSEHIMEAVNTLYCVYYLVKPFTENDILKMLSKVFNTIEASFTSYLYFRNTQGIETKINTADIVFIKSIRHDIEVYTKYKTLNFINYNLSKLEEDAAGMLVRCHKSYLISVKYLSYIDKTNNYVTLNLNNQNATIPIGRTYASKLYEKAHQ